MMKCVILTYAKVSLLLLANFSFYGAVVGLGDEYQHYPTKISYEYLQKSKCLNPPRTARRVENFIGECQEEVKNKLVKEAYQILKEEVANKHPKVVQHDDYAFDLIKSEQQQQPLQKPSNQWPNAIWLPTPTPINNHAEQEQSPQQYLEYLDITTPFPATTSPRKRVARLLHRIRRIGDITQGTGIYHPTLVPYEDKRIAGCLLHCVYAKNDAIDKNGWPTLDGLVDFYSEGVNEHGFFMATLRSVNLCLRAVTNRYHVDRRKLPEHGESCDLAFDVFDCISDQITGYCLDQYK